MIQHIDASKLPTRWEPPPLPMRPPKGWKEMDLPSVLKAMGSPPGAQRIFRRNDGLTVIVDCAEKLDGRLWLHASFSRPDRIPSYFDIKDVKYIFIGPHRKAIQVFPEEREHVNFHSNCLHLWCCLEGDPLPDFSFGMGTI